MPSSRGSSQPRNQTCISLTSPALESRFFITSATWGEEMKAFSLRLWTGQGCPLSQLLFNTAFEVLATLIEKAMAPHSSILAWKNPMDGGAWWSAVHGVATSRTQLSDFTLSFHALEKEKATHSSVLAWRIPGMGEPGGPPSMGSPRVEHDWSNLVAAAAALEEVRIWYSGMSRFLNTWIGYLIKIEVSVLLCLWS